MKEYKFSHQGRIILKQLLQQDGGSRMKILNTTDESNNLFINKEFKEMCGNKYIPAIIGKVDRIIVFGDIHGDLQLAIKMLETAKLAKNYRNGKMKWIGNSTYVVQVGDQIDRCRPFANKTCNQPDVTYNDENSDILILELFTDLNRQAEREGGAVISLLGNHEIKNSLGEFEYVSKMGIDGFQNYIDPDNPNIKFRNGMDGRKHAFLPGNEYGKHLGCNRSPSIIIGSNLFVHAGLVDGLIKEIGLNGIEDFEAINIAIRKWLLGMIDVEHIDKIIRGSKYSMFWTRILGSLEPNTPISDPKCQDNIKEVLKMFNIGSIIVGHTPQSFSHSNDINSTCNGKVWRVDNGASSAFHRFDRQFMQTGVVNSGRRIQYLEILNDNVYRICDEKGCK
jgi:hypothetical protein